MTTRVAVIGATGKMGHLISELVERSADFELVAQLGSANDLADMLPADLAVDVTRPGVSEDVVDYAVDHGLRVLVGTSGWSEERIAALERRVDGREETGVVIIPNFSLGSVLATYFATLAAPFYDSVEIIEAHHAGKVDSPSGTAVRTAELMSAARAAQGPVSAPHTDQRARGQQVGGIPVHSLRLAGVLARQDVILGGGGETLTIRHDTTSPSAYEQGILLGLTAARDAVGVTVGLDQLIPLGPRAGQEP